MSDKISTITQIDKFKGEIYNIDFILLLLPVSFMSWTGKESIDKNLMHSTPGSIISLSGFNPKGDYVTRGYKKPEKKKKKKPGFKNNLSCKISIGDKNISLKISSGTIHITGAKKDSHIKEATYYLLYYLKRIQKYLDLINNNFDMYLNVVSWIKENCIGEAITVETVYFNNKIKIIDYIDNNQIKIPKIIPSHLDNKLTLFLLSFIENDNFIDGFKYYKEYKSFIENIHKIKKIISDDYEKISANPIMINKNYSLGFRINKNNLYEKFSSIKNFESFYDNRYSKSVSIYLPLSKELSRDQKIKNKKERRTSFLVYSNGSVTQSSPDINNLNDAYHIFIEKINEMKDDIISLEIEKTNKS